MKKRVRTLNVILLTAIYCFSMGFGAKSFIYSDIHNTQTAEQEIYFSPVSTTLFCDTSQSENAVNNLNNYPTESFKTLFNGLWAVTKTTEQFYETAFTQYTCFSRNFLIHHRKANIIFPFQYFW